jgi:hypothetical protein
MAWDWRRVVFSKINVWQIIVDHIDTLRDHATKRVTLGDVVLFFFVPVLIAALLLFPLGFTLDKSAANVLVTSLSIFSALLFNLLLLVYDIIRKEERSVQKKPLVAEFLRQIYANISFSILVAVFCVALLLLVFLDIELRWFYDVISFIVYGLVVQFLLTMFMVLKRVHVLLTKEIDS